MFIACDENLISLKPIYGRQKTLRSSGAVPFVCPRFYKHHAATRLKPAPSLTVGLLPPRYHERFQNYCLSKIRKRSLLVFA